MPPSHYCEFCLRTNTNWHSLRIAHHRINSNYFVFVRCHFRISSQANANVLKCSKHSYWPLELKHIRIASYCIVERRNNSCQFLLVRISSLYIRIDSLYIRTGTRRLSVVTQYLVIRCATIALSHWIAHVRIGSCKLLLVPIVFSSHQSAIVLILHHHRTASYCIVSPSCCILLHLTTSYQFVFNSCLIRIDSQIIIVPNRSGSAYRGRPGTNPKCLTKKSPPFARDVIRIDSYNYSPQWDGGFRLVDSTLESRVPRDFSSASDILSDVILWFTKVIRNHRQPKTHRCQHSWPPLMVTSSNGSIYRVTVTGPLSGKFTSHR